MNDRFAATLRQHLLDTADDHPADGQLAAVIDGVTATSQRHPVAARLTAFPGRALPVPGATLRFGLVAVALVAATVAAAVFVAGGPSGRTPFEGTWTTTDATDGSTMFLVLGAGSSPAVRFVDELASGPVCAGDDVKVYTADGTGRIVDNRLDTEWPNGGSCGLITEPMPRVSLVYDAASGTLIDNLQKTWVRAQGAVVPTPGPAKPLASGDGNDPDCDDIPPGATYRFDVGALSLTATVPADTAFEWQGYVDAFEMAERCDFGDPVLITASIPTVVYAACDTSGGVDVTTPAGVVAQLTGSEAYIASAPTQVTVGGYAATRFEIDPASSSCPHFLPLWENAEIRYGALTVVYVVDVDGIPLGITIQNRRGQAATAQVAEAEGIVATLQIDR